MSKKDKNQFFFSFYDEIQQDPLFFEKEAYAKGYCKIAGVDEAGRGPLAGPLVVASCILPKGLFLAGVNDSKQLTPFQRQTLYSQITTHPSIVYAIEVIEHTQVDEMNILQATLQGMKQVVESLTTSPDFILVDGPYAPFSPEKSKAIIKGDFLSHTIACASILAKVTRDEIMDGYDMEWPEYGFIKNKGYGTQEHLEALRRFGPSPIHRRSFAPVQKSLIY